MRVQVSPSASKENLNVWLECGGSGIEFPGQIEYNLEKIQEEIFDLRKEILREKI